MARESFVAFLGSAGLHLLERLWIVFFDRPFYATIADAQGLRGYFSCISSFSVQLGPSRVHRSGGHDSCLGGGLVEIRLEAGEEVAADFLGATEVGNGVGQGVLIFETEQRRELFLIDLVDALFDIVGTNEIQENLLLAVER